MHVAGRPHDPPGVVLALAQRTVVSYFQTDAVGDRPVDRDRRGLASFSFTSASPTRLIASLAVGSQVAGELLDLGSTTSAAVSAAPVSVQEADAVEVGLSAQPSRNACSDRLRARGSFEQAVSAGQDAQQRRERRRRWRRI